MTNTFLKPRPVSIVRATCAAVASFLALTVSVAADDHAAPAPSPQGLARITSFFGEEVATGRLAGAVLLIQQHGHPVYFRCFGARDVSTGVPMSAGDTADRQRARLAELGLRVRELEQLRDIDTVEDARAVAAVNPWTRMAAALRELD